MSDTPRVLSDAQLQRFIDDGYVRLDDAFPQHLAQRVRSRLWRDLAWSPDDPSTWTEPAVRLGMYTDPHFLRAANTPRLHGAFDQLVGPGRWLPCGALGTFRCAFPSTQDPDDTGWHVDPSFDYHNPDFLSWRVNIHSKGRALLMLFLFSDVGPDDAPTRLRHGSHRDIARQLAPAGSAGLTLRELAFDATEHRETTLATGPAGTVYLCHPFLVHAAQPHRGTRPRFLAQPPLLPQEADAIREGPRESPIELAIAQ